MTSAEFLTIDNVVLVGQKGSLNTFPWACRSQQYNPGGVGSIGPGLTTQVRIHYKQITSSWGVFVHYFQITLSWGVFVHHISCTKTLRKFQTEMNSQHLNNISVKFLQKVIFLKNVKVYMNLTYSDNYSPCENTSALGWSALTFLTTFL
jgi:hypothetical protein